MKKEKGVRPSIRRIIYFSECISLAFHGHILIEPLQVLLHDIPDQLWLTGHMPGTGIDDHPYRHPSLLEGAIELPAL